MTNDKNDDYKALSASASPFGTLGSVASTSGRWATSEGGRAGPPRRSKAAVITELMAVDTIEWVSSRRPRSDDAHIGGAKKRPSRPTGNLKARVNLDKL